MEKKKFKRREAREAPNSQAKSGQVHAVIIESSDLKAFFKPLVNI